MLIKPITYWVQYYSGTTQEQKTYKFLQDLKERHMALLTYG